jgi:hypothetical protein
VRDAALRTVVLLAAILAVPAPLRAQVQTFDGTLIIVWGDPDPALGGGGVTQYSLALTDGRTIRLQLAGQEGLAESYFSRPVTVSGEFVFLEWR